MTERHDDVAVLMLGEDLDRPGGVVTVQKMILGHASGAMRFTHVPTLKDGSSLAKFLVFCRAIVSLIARLTSRKFGLVHIHVSTGGSVYRQTLTALIALIFRRRVVMHAHSGKFPSFYQRQPAIVRAAIVAVFRRCDRLIVVSPHWRCFYADRLGIDPARIVVLPNPVALPAIPPARPAKLPVKMVFFGQVNRAKGVFDLLKATTSLADNPSNSFEVIIAGHGDIQVAKAEAEELGAGSTVTFLGWVDPEQRNMLLAEADVFLLPSYFEGLPMALLEAMSWALPSITTPVGGIPDIVDHEVEGLLIEPGDVDGLVAAMQRLIDDPPLRERLGRAARRRVEPLDVTSYMKTLTAIYQHLDAQHR